MTVLLGTPTPPLARKSGKYTCLNLLGQGTYGTCYKVLEKPKSTPCVMKVIPLSDLKTHDVQAAFSEAMLLSTIKHPHVVGYLDAWVENSHLYIVMEYCRGGDLGLLLRGRQLSILEVLQYGRDMACGMQHLHAHRIMHRDIKPSNMFLHDDSVVIGDLGLGKRMEQVSVANTQVGTPLYFSPEVCREETYALSSDVWAFGCVLYEMLAGTPPYAATNQVALSDKICRGPAPTMPSRCPPQLGHIITAALQKLPDRRPSMDKCHEMISTVYAATAAPPLVDLGPIGSSAHTRVSCPDTNTATVEAAPTHPNSHEPQSPHIAPQDATNSSSVATDNLQPLSILKVLQQLQSDNAKLRELLDASIDHPSATAAAETTCTPVQPPCITSVATTALGSLPAGYHAQRPRMHAIPPVASFEQSATGQVPSASASADSCASDAVLPAEWFPRTHTTASCSTPSQHPACPDVQHLPPPLQVPTDQHHPSTVASALASEDTPVASMSDAAAQAPATVGVSRAASTVPEAEAWDSKQHPEAAGLPPTVPDKHSHPILQHLPSSFDTSTHLGALFADCSASVAVLSAAARESPSPAAAHSRGAVSTLVACAQKSPEGAIGAAVGDVAESTRGPESESPQCVPGEGALHAPACGEGAMHASDCGEGTMHAPPCEFGPPNSTTQAVSPTSAGDKGTALSGAAAQCAEHGGAAERPVRAAAEQRQSQARSSMPAVPLCVAEACAGCSEAVRFIQTLHSKVAGLESVLSSTTQRAAADRHALDALRNERAELQDCLRTGGHLSLSPGMSILTHLPEVTPCSPVGAKSATTGTRCNDSNGNTDSIAAFLPPPRGQVATTLMDHGTIGDGVVVEDASPASPALQRDPLRTPAHTPQRLHKRAHVDTPADLKKLLERSLEASRLPGHGVAVESNAGAAARCYRATVAGAQHSARSARSSSGSYDSMQCHRAISDRCTSDRSMATGDPINACGDKFHPFPPVSTSAVPVSVCDTLIPQRTHAHHGDTGVHSTNTATVSVGSIHGSPYCKPRARVSLVDESPDLSPAACVLQRLPDRMHGRHALYDGSVLEQSCGEWFGSRSSGSGSRLGNLTYLQMSGGSSAHMRSVDASVVDQTHHQLYAATEKPVSTPGATAQGNGNPNPDPGQVPPRSPRTTHPPNVSTRAELPASPASVDNTQHVQLPQHASDQEQTSHEPTESAQRARWGSVRDSVRDSVRHSTTAPPPECVRQQAVSAHDDVIRAAYLQAAAEQDSAVAARSGSVRSGSSSQGALLETIADMRRTLQEDCGAPPSPRAGQPGGLQGATHAASATAPEQIETHLEASAVAGGDVHEQMQHSGVGGAASEQLHAHASELGPAHASEHGPAQQLPHVLGRCQGAACFTPSPHPKKRQQASSQPLEAVYPPAGVAGDNPPLDPFNTPQSTPLKASAAAAPITDRMTEDIQSRNPPVPLQHTLVSPGTHTAGASIGPDSRPLGPSLGFLTPQHPSRHRISHADSLRGPTTCSKIPGTWQEATRRATRVDNNNGATATYSRNLTATPPRGGARHAAWASGLEGAVPTPSRASGAEASPRLQAFRTPGAQSANHKIAYSKFKDNHAASSGQHPLN